MTFDLLITLDGKINTELMDPSIVNLIVCVRGYAAEMKRKSILKRTAEGHEVSAAAGVKGWPRPCGSYGGRAVATERSQQSWASPAARCDGSRLRRPDPKSTE